MILKLTLTQGNKPIYINTDHIETISPGAESGCSCIDMMLKDGEGYAHSYIVNESADTIAAAHNTHAAVGKEL